MPGLVMESSRSSYVIGIAGVSCGGKAWIAWITACVFGSVSLHQSSDPKV